MTTDELDYSPFQQVPTGEYPCQLVRKTVELPSNVPLTADHVRLAVDRAVRWPLRQSVGSCFATALAILIQKDRPDLLLRDLAELLYTEKLVRIVEGHECLIPISPYADGECPLLQVWEFTLATLTDYNQKAYRYNFHHFLGIHPDSPEGIGQALLTHMQRNFETQKEGYEKILLEMEEFRGRLNGAQMRLGLAYREEEMRRIQSEIFTENWRLDQLELEAREMEKELIDLKEGSKLFFDELDFSLLREFYEVYDPEICGNRATVLSDSAAGFRLVWKNGLQAVDRHVRIHDLDGYLIALKEFFISFEHRLQVDFPKLRRLIAECSSIITQQIHSMLFQQKAAKLTPWAYPSGGSLETVLEGYFETKGPFQTEICRPEKPLDLFVFYLDLLKSLSLDTLELFENKKWGRLLALFPTHAFTLLPASPLFREGWRDRGFSYTWIRDRLIDPSKKIFQKHADHHQKTKLWPRIIFADTNWASASAMPYFFAFALDPRTQEVGIARTTGEKDPLIFLDEWQLLFNGKEVFTVFTRPFQYGGPYTAPRLWQRI